MDSPKSGNYHDLNDIEFVLKEILSLLKEAKIEHKGLFLNADAGIDSRDLRSFLQKKEIISNSNKISEMDKMKIFILMKNYIKIGLK
ncbi:hypothetical protein [Capnocytophaga cynodegmi]|uniref:Uncharacterized protein n=2 Tax=Capnocytophaga cynodegmi TaxID=28189 RepID=A0A0B7HN72_9FLAO|nr:hypothetical protein [Capnocytophaga cynodegmi]CEN40094.1 hypothetical protein CCYN2B_90047 [Capnocytophaga cynodegmi]